MDAFLIILILPTTANSLIAYDCEGEELNVTTLLDIETCDLPDTTRNATNWRTLTLAGRTNVNGKCQGALYADEYSDRTRPKMAKRSALRANRRSDRTRPNIADRQSPPQGLPTAERYQKRP
ncbi:hypothetical protein ALC62_01853 [Cyphomyrmex costatus]|uniref:Uncharacterized protein n=1 Tax=Cyphomyrmex costatus TaxID=456900 RepID=A0A151INY5_9HYME|nr:hypothetical protein ALC62_01853 [Cyphomyrmex costatus]